MAALVSIADALTTVVVPDPPNDAPTDLAIDPDTGDYVLTAGGELAGVSGEDRALMDLVLLASTPAGSCLSDPEHGNLLAVLGAPMPDAADMQMRVQALAQSLADLQAARAAEGTPPGAAEVVQSVAVTNYDVAPNRASVSLLATFATGTGNATVPAGGTVE